MRNAGVRRPERRQFGRRQICERGHIETPDGRQRPCLVVDISDGGARIQLSGPEAAPAAFQLVLPGLDMKVACEVVHEVAGQLGLAFTRSPRRLTWGVRSTATDPHRNGREGAGRK